MVGWGWRGWGGGDEAKCTEKEWVNQGDGIPSNSHSWPHWLGSAEAIFNSPGISAARMSIFRSAAPHCRSSSSMLLYVHRDHKDHWRRGAQDGHPDFYAASELWPHCRIASSVIYKVPSSSMQWVLSITCSELSACSQQMQPDTQNVSCNMHNGTLSRQTACENAVNIIARFTLNTIPKTVLPLTQDKLVVRTLRLFHTARFTLNTILKTVFPLTQDKLVVRTLRLFHTARFTLNTILKTVLLLIQDKLVVRTLRLFHIATFILNIILKIQFFLWLKTNWLWEHWGYFILQDSSWRHSSSDSRQTGCEKTEIISYCKLHHPEDTQFFSWQMSCQKPTRLPQTLWAVFFFLLRSICLKPAVAYH